MLSCEKVSAWLQPATAIHARLMLSKAVPFFCTGLYTLIMDSVHALGPRQNKVQVIICLNSCWAVKSLYKIWSVKYATSSNTIPTPEAGDHILLYISSVAAIAIAAATAAVIVEKISDTPLPLPMGELRVQFTHKGDDDYDDGRIGLPLLSEQG